MFLNLHSHFSHSKILTISQFEEGSNVDFYSYGIHPNNANLLPQKNIFFDRASNPKCLAIGEIGLDKLSTTDWTTQIHAFETQACWAEELKKPVILHCVKSWNEILEHKKRLNPKQAWIFHGFRKTSLLKSVLDTGVFISIGTAVLHDLTLQQIIPDIPLDSLFLETDMDERYTIEEVYECVCKLKNISLQDLENQVEENFKKIFHTWEIGLNEQSY